MRPERRRRSAIDPRHRQQPLRDGHPESARCRDPAASRRRHQPATTKIDEIPFDFERRRLSVVVEAAGPATPAADHERRARAVVADVHGDRSGRTAVPLTDDTAQACIAVHERMSGDGLRVLAVAYRWLDRRADATRARMNGPRARWLCRFADPVLPDAADVMAELKRDGVTVKILTGDNERVARHVCEQIGARRRADRDRRRDRALDDAALGHVAEQATVFARVSPAQKNRIILALKRRGHVVGFIGDGINDAPSLHTADVGISVMTAADVARDAADVILRQPGLRVLHRGILEGRRASGNMMKYLLMGTSSNFGNMFSMAAASVFLPFLPMLPTQILLNNFLYDLAQITIPTDNVDRGYLQPPSAMGHAPHSRFHAVDRADQLAVRLSDVLCAAALLPRDRTAVSHGLVRRVAGDADARALRHPHDGQSAGEPAESRPDRDDAGRGAVSLALPATPLARGWGSRGCRGRISCFLFR